MEPEQFFLDRADSPFRVRIAFWVVVTGESLVYLQHGAFSHKPGSRWLAAVVAHQVESAITYTTGKCVCIPISRARSHSTLRL